MRQRIAFIFIASVFAGLAAAGISAILPYQYTAKGLLVVTRKVNEPSDKVFTYEGYYAQQSAGAYTATFLSILQSPNNLKTADDSVDPKRLARLIKAKKEGPQAIVLSVKSQTPESAVNLWEKVANAAIQTHNKFINSADPLLDVAKTPNSPVVLRTYPEWTDVFGAGSMFSIIILSSALVIFQHIKENHDN